MTEEVVWFKQ